MIPVYICDDELPIRKNLEQIVGNQILIDARPPPPLAQGVSAVWKNFFIN